MFCQPMRGLIDADYQCIRVFFRNERGAHTGTAERIEDQRSAITLPTLKQLLERFPGMRRAGLSPRVVLMAPHNIRQVRMGCDLIGLQHCLVSGRRRCLRSSSHLAIIPRICCPTDPSQRNA